MDDGNFQDRIPFEHNDSLVEGVDTGNIFDMFFDKLRCLCYSYSRFEIYIASIFHNNGEELHACHEMLRGFMKRKRPKTYCPIIHTHDSMDMSQVRGFLQKLRDGKNNSHCESLSHYSLCRSVSISST